MKNENLIDGKKSKKGKIFDIVSWVIVLILFAGALLLLLTRKGEGTINIFGHRYDVVLTTSMATRNENHLDFLEGTEQIQKMDVVRSQTIDESTELNVKDVVIYKDPKIGTNMHRIVDIKLEHQDIVSLQEATISENGEITLAVNNSAIYTNEMYFTSMVFEIYSNSETFSDGYYFSYGTMVQTYTVNTVPVGDRYCHTVTLKRSSASRTDVTIVHSKGFDYASEHFGRIIVDSTYGRFEIDGNDFDIINPDLAHYVTNETYLYQIRGDAAKTEDGWFKRENIYSKVDKVVPKAGYAVRYLTSIQGIVMLVGIGILILAADLIFEFINKKEKAKPESGEIVEEKDHEDTKK